MKRYVDALNANIPISLARYGDGEFATMFGEDGENCDGHKYYPQMGIDLLHTLRVRRPYDYGMVRVARTVYGEKIDRFLKYQAIPISWVDGTMFKDASSQGKLYPLVKALRSQSSILYVGPRALDTGGLEDIFCCRGYVEIPEKNAYAFRQEIMQSILTMVKAVKFDVIGFSAGPLTKILIWELWPAIGARTSLIDFGSLWDGFCGRPARSYQKTKEWQRLMKKNLYGTNR